MAVFIPITGMKTEGGHEQSPGAVGLHGQRPQLTVFTASAFSSLAPQMWRAGQSGAVTGASGRGRKRSCPLKASDLGDLHSLPSTALKQKIPRPPNAFMLFANDWRRKLASQFPKESNKDISIRLGGMWKTMEKDEKEKYFQYAREVDAAHKKKYPDYVYNPKEARMRKALREQSRGERQGGPTGSGQRGGAPAPWSKHRQIMNHRQPICVQMVGEHQQSVAGVSTSSSSAAGAAVVCGARDDPCGAKSAADSAGGGMLQNFNDYLDLSYHPVAQAGDYTILPDIDQSSWYPYLQGPVQNAPTYLMRAGPEKVASSSDWGSHFAADNSSAFIHTNSQNAAERDVNGHANGGYIDSSREQLTVNGGTHHSEQRLSVTSPGEQDKAQDQANHDSKLQEAVLGSNMVDNKSLLDLPQIKAECQNGIESTSNRSKDVLRLPGFHQAFGSTEIGRFSQHDEFFEVTMPQPEPQPETKMEVVTPPRGKFLDGDFQNSNCFLSPGTPGTKAGLMSPSMWPFLYPSPTKASDGSTVCFSSPTFPHGSGLPFVDYSFLSNPDFMQSNNEEIIPEITSCTTENHNSATNNIYAADDKDFPVLLTPDCNGFSQSIKPLKRLSDTGPDKPGVLELCRKSTTSQETEQNSIRVKSAEEFANQDLKMNCVNHPPVIISENDKICVILESSNVGLDSCVKEFTSL